MKKQRSFSQKHWVAFDTKESIGLPKSLESLQEILLQNRGLGDHEAIDQFLSPSLGQLSDPFEMTDMEAAVDRIFSALQQNERIVVFGDFDTDGITATVILVWALQQLGAKVSYRIPERNTDSHGLKKEILAEIAAKKVSLVITVDCATNNQAEIDFAVSKGLDVIVTDHHALEKGRFPSAAMAVVNPHRDAPSAPWHNLSGAGVAWKVVAALAQKVFCQTPEKISELLWPLLELAAIGTISDCVPLQGENRILAKFGLEKMQNSSWDGLRRLLAEVPTPTEETIAFSIAPRLNAASRVGDVLVAVQLFLGAASSNAARIARLDRWNEERKIATEQAIAESRLQIETTAHCQVFSGEWTPGILGLLASRHAEQLGVPVVACTLRSDGKLTASARAPEGASIIAALQEQAGLFSVFGGHDGAAGFVTDPEQLEQIRCHLQSHFSLQKKADLALKVDAFVSPTLLNFALIDFLSFLAPFGAGNPQPVFGVCGVRLLQLVPMGEAKNHLRLTGVVEGESLEAVAFFADHLRENLSPGDTVDLAVTVSENTWNGERRCQLRVVDVRKS